MITLFASSIPYTILQQNGKCTYYPYLLNSNGDIAVQCLTPIHCRSVIVDCTIDNRYIVTKGNGLAYSTETFLHTPESPMDVWGLLLKTDALRDFYCCQDVQALGIKTNQMQCVMELDYPVTIPQTGVTMKPCILQYSVECPYRIADAGFMASKQIWDEVTKWERFNDKGFQNEYLIAADVLIHNLKLMHDNGILHNALTYENVTWALELLDFELCHTPQHPYSQEDNVRHVPDLFDREINDTYRLINYIAGVLQQKIDYHKVDELFLDYGFDLKMFVI